MAVSCPIVVPEASSIVWMSVRRVLSAVDRAEFDVPVPVPGVQPVVVVVVELPVLELPGRIGVTGKLVVVADFELLVDTVDVVLDLAW